MIGATFFIYSIESKSSFETPCRLVILSRSSLIETVKPLISMLIKTLAVFWIGRF